MELKIIRLLLQKIIRKIAKRQNIFTAFKRNSELKKLIEFKVVRGAFPKLRKPTVACQRASRKRKNQRKYKQLVKNSK